MSWMLNFGLNVGWKEVNELDISAWTTDIYSDLLLKNSFKVLWHNVKSNVRFLEVWTFHQCVTLEAHYNTCYMYIWNPPLGPFWMNLIDLVI